MGTGASVDNKPRCPYHRMCQAQVKKAKTARYNDGEASDFYFHCSNGNTDEVRKILEAPDRQPIDELVKLERNGDTALHVATEKGHAEIVKLLLEHNCSRIILNHFGKVAAEVAVTPEMKRLFIRSETSDRFHDSNPSNTMTVYLPEVNEAVGTKNETLKFAELFETEEEICKYSLNHQTTAMWLKFYNWFSRTFPSFLQRENLSLEAFDLHKNTDFQDFLKKKTKDEDHYKKTLEEFDKAHNKNSIDSLLTIYSKEELGFYRSLNQQLADSPAEPDTSPHLCDRFIIEFHIRGAELADRAFIGTAYRGATIDSNALSVYEQAYEKKPRGVVIFKSFTSTSEDKYVALDFISKKPLERHQTNVLYIIVTKVKSPTIIGIANVSDYQDEQEILFMPGNLFVVKKLVKDVTVYTKDQKRIILTEVHLEYLHIPVSFWRKLVHTYRSANNSVT
jgi:hypothetical protein